jgi:hypothetical protein
MKINDHATRFYLALAEHIFFSTSARILSWLAEKTGPN